MLADHLQGVGREWEVCTVSWESERRLDYIDFRLATAGHIGRTDLMRTFGISVVVASQALNEYLKQYHGAMRYDKSAKRYLGRGRERLNLPQVTAIQLLEQIGHPMGWI